MVKNLKKETKLPTAFADDSTQRPQATAIKLQHQAIIIVGCVAVGRHMVFFFRDLGSSRQEGAKDGRKNPGLA